MASDPKMSAPPESPSSVKHRDKGIRIFTYPKVIFIFPTLIAALICGLGMSLIRDNTVDPLKGRAKMAAGAETGKNQSAPAAANKGQAATHEEQAAEAVPPRHRRFTTPQNLLGVLFLSVFAFNLLDHGDRLPPVHGRRGPPPGRVRRVLHPLDRRLLRRRPDELRARAHGQHLRGGERRVLLHDRADPDHDLLHHLRHAVPRLLGDPAQRDPPPPRPAQRPRAVPHDEPQVRQGDPRRPRVPLPGRGPARAPRHRGAQGDRPGQRAVHQRQGRGARRS